jgi:hypothetical protein
MTSFRFDESTLDPRKKKSFAKSHRPRPTTVPYEIQEWNAFADRLIDLLSNHVDAPAVSVDTPTKKRIVLESMCTQLCRRDQENAARAAKHDRLQHKYEQSQLKLKHLGQKCTTLTEDIERSRAELEENLKSVRTREQAAIDEKLSHLEELLSQQMEEQQRILEHQQAAPTAGHTKPTSKRSHSVSRPPPERPPNLMDFDPKTTAAITKYRKRTSLTQINPPHKRKS